MSSSVSHLTSKLWSRLLQQRDRRVTCSFQSKTPVIVLKTRRRVLKATGWTKTAKLWRRLMGSKCYSLKCLNRLATAIKSLLQWFMSRLKPRAALTCLWWFLDSQMVANLNSITYSRNNNNNNRSRNLWRRKKSLNLWQARIWPLQSGSSSAKCRKWPTSHPR